MPLILLPASLVRSGHNGTWPHSQQEAGMPLFGRRSRARNGLLTAIISAGTGPHGGEWEVIWIGQGGKEPRRLVTTSLSKAAEQATTAALAHFAEGRLIPEAELQFAIYPWDYGKMAPMYDITAEVGQYKAHDIVADGPDIAAPTLEELVEQMAVQPRGNEAMLRWVRRIQDLPTAATG
jgi:hypothetical protein